MKIQNTLVSSMREIPLNLEACANFTSGRYKRKIVVSCISTLITNKLWVYLNGKT